MKYSTRSIILIDDARRLLAKNVIDNAPAGLEVVVREPVKKRSLDQNSMLWAGPMTDLEQQGWVHGKQYTAEVWHEHCKAEFLPEEGDPELALLVVNVEKYKKWAMKPNGDRVCVGSTTALSKLGFSRYMEQIFALGAGLGVHFTEAR